MAMVDDSIVRGTTSKKLVDTLRNFGATEVHMLVSSPPVLHPCYYGIDTSERSELIAARMDLDEVRNFIGADSLNYLSQEGLYQAMGKKEGFCAACLDGQYPIQIPSPEEVGKHIFENPRGRGSKSCVRKKD